MPNRRRLAALAGTAVLAATTATGQAQVASVNAWDASQFRVWAYIPYWTSQSQIDNFDNNGMYGHVSDVLHFGGLRPDASGNIAYASATYQTQLDTIRAQMQTSGFKLHLSMFEVNGGAATDATWLSIINSPTNRANFVAQVKSRLQGAAGTADDLAGFNFDWERPSTAAEWGNYTQLARELRAAINPLGMEVSVCDYGSTDTDWDGTSLFDAKVYDQLMIMGYHYTASQNNGFANGKIALNGQGAAKAFSDDQLTIGIGTWGEGPSTATMQQIVTANPNLPYNASTFTGTIGSTTGTWNIESREQVRAKTQLALDRNMAGMFSWTLHYDATGNLGLHRVMQHYIDVKRNTPDLDLNGLVNAADATTLANNMGMVLTNTGMATASQFDAFYLGGNWEKGDHDGNGFVNQADADWLASRYTALNVALPDRLAYGGTFESFSDNKGLTGRWRGARDSGVLRETSNFKQESANFLAWSGTGPGASKRSNQFVTMRNRNTAEVTAGANTLSRSMLATLATPIYTSQDKDFYFTFLAKENTSALSATQLASSNRVLSLDFLDSFGTDQFDFMLRGQQQDFFILSEADGGGQDVSTGGVTAGQTYLVVGKISGHGSGANTLHASVFASGANVGDFTASDFAWMLNATGSAGYNPVLTDLRFVMPGDTNFTVSNVWLGDAPAFAIPEPGAVSLLALAAGAAAVRRRRH
jgi:GH18 family chitinase